MMTIIDAPAVTIKHARLKGFNIIKEYKHLLFPLEESLLVLKNKHIEFVFSVALIDDKAVGAICSFMVSKDRLKIISLFVYHEYRNVGVAEELIRSFVLKSKKAGIKESTFTYNTFWKDYDFLDQKLKSGGFDITDTNIVYGHIKNLQLLRDENWVKRASISADYDIVRLDPNKVRALRAWIELVKDTVTIHRDIYPDKNPEATCDQTSLLLLHQGDIAGWIVTHNVDDDKCQVSSLFIRSKYGQQESRLGLSLLAEAINRSCGHREVFWGMRKDNNYINRFLNYKVPDKVQYYKKLKAIIQL